MGLIDSESLVQLLGAGDVNSRVIANNLANLNTPGYRTSRVEFSKELDGILNARGGLEPGAEITTRKYQPLFSDVSHDGNDVELAREIAELNKNDLRMRFYLNVLSIRIRTMRDTIAGSR